MIRKYIIAEIIAVLLIAGIAAALYRNKGNVLSGSVSNVPGGAPETVVFSGNAIAGRAVTSTWFHYATSYDFAKYESYTFGYSMDLAVETDEIWNAGGGNRHVVILALKNASGTNASTMSDTIEINVHKGILTCSFYAKCRIISGITIGTNASDAAFLKLFDETAASFKVWPSQPPPGTPRFSPPL